MRALITNDDGIDSPGLTVLAEAALAQGYEVVVAAPARESSGASASLMGAEADGRLVINRERPPGLPGSVESYGVRATPGLITLLAAFGGFGPKPDLVLSGINRGANTGHAILHSGTAGAAFTASTHQIPALAVSTNATDPQHWDTSRHLVDHVLTWMLANPDPGRVVNLNVPDRPLDRVRGLRKAPLASFGMVQAHIDPLDDEHLSLSFAGTDAAQEPDSDAGMLVRGWATITLLHAPAFLADAELPELDLAGADLEDDDGPTTVDAGVAHGTAPGP